VGPAEVREFCQTDDAGKSLLRAATSQLGMSARAFHRILKLAWKVCLISTHMTWQRPFGIGRVDTYDCDVLEYGRRRVGLIKTSGATGHNEQAVQPACRHAPPRKTACIDSAVPL